MAALLQVSSLSKWSHELSLQAQKSVLAAASVVLTVRPLRTTVSEAITGSFGSISIIAFIVVVTTRRTPTLLTSLLSLTPTTCRRGFFFIKHKDLLSNATIEQLLALRLLKCLHFTLNLCPQWDIGLIKCICLKGDYESLQSKRMNSDAWW